MRRVLLILSVVLLGALLQPSTLHALTPATGCQWLYSAGGVGQFANLFADPDATPLPNLRFGAAFVESSNIARNGLLDFDGDNRQDVFRAVPRQDGFLQWQYSSGGAGAWVNLAYAGIPLDDLRFGDFDGDGKTDVFADVPQADGRRQWVYSAGGVANFTVLKTISAAAHALYGVPQPGDFDGDGVTDLFARLTLTPGTVVTIAVADAAGVPGATYHVSAGAALETQAEQDSSLFLPVVAR